MRTILAASLIAAAILTCTIAVGYVLVRANAIFLAFFAAIVLGEALRPPIERLAKSMPRALAVALVLVAIYAAIALVTALPLRAAMPEIVNLVQTLPSQVAALLSSLKAGSVFGFSLAGISAGAPAVIERIAGIGNALSLVGLALLLVPFWLASSGSLRNFILSLFEPRARPTVDGVFAEIGAKFAGYVVGTLVNGTIVGLGCTLALLLLGAQQAIVLGALQGLLVAIPYLGTLVGVVTVAVYVTATSGVVVGAEATALVTLTQVIEGSFIAPLIFKSRLNVDPLATVLATAVGGAIFGIPGIALAVPAVATIQTLVERVVAPAMRARTAA